MPKAAFGVKKTKFLTPEMYDVQAGEIRAIAEQLASLTNADSGALPADDLSIDEDGNPNSDFDQAAAYALQCVEAGADALKSKAATLRSALNNRPKPSPDAGVVEDEGEDQGEAPAQ